MTTFQLLMVGILNAEKNSVPVMIDAGSQAQHSILGYNVIVDYGLKDTKHKTWIFPKDPFVIYEDKDEDLCRYCGWGKPTDKWEMGELQYSNMTVRDKDRLQEFIKTKVLSNATPKSLRTKKHTLLPRP